MEQEADGRGYDTLRSDSGFRATLSGASLADLVQMECLAHSNGAFRINSGERVGYLFFQTGNLIHAFTDDLSGEDAALEILKWQKGTFEPANASWPSAPTIHTGWQNLLLRVAQARDESGRRRLVSLPARKPGPAVAPTNAMQRETPSLEQPRPPPLPRAAGHGSASSKGPAASGNSTSPLARALPSDAAFHGLEAFVRLDPTGNVITSRGRGQDLAPVAAYAARLCAIIGEILGMQQLMALECARKNSRSIVHLEKSGNLVAVQTLADADLGSVRQRVGL
jgi:Domain of unknown function (DUF4388)